MAVTLFLGVVVVGLALKGLAVNKIQNDAIEKLVRIFSNFFPPSELLEKEGEKNASIPFQTDFFVFVFFFPVFPFSFFYIVGAKSK